MIVLPEVNERMRDCIIQAVQERAARVRGAEMNEYHLGIVLRASFKIGAKGFKPETIWRALQLATEPSSPVSDGAGLREGMTMTETITTTVLMQTDMAAALEIASRFNPRKMPWIAMVIAKHMGPERERLAAENRLLKKYLGFIESCHCPSCSGVRAAIAPGDSKTFAVRSDARQRIADEGARQFGDDDQPTPAEPSSNQCTRCSGSGVQFYSSRGEKADCPDCNGTGKDTPAKPSAEGKAVIVIYRGGYVPDLGIVQATDLQGWLVYRHPDGQWVTLTDLKRYAEHIRAAMAEEGS